MMLPEERYNRILELLEEHGTIRTNELIQLLNTSRETVRRDLNTLAERGALIKTHGGAASAENTAAFYYIPIMLRETTNVAEKKALCKYAANLVSDRDTIFIDNSSTASWLLSFIPKGMHLTVITNSIKLAYEFPKFKAPDWSAICIGGTLDIDTLSTNNYLATTNLSIFRPNKAFLSCHGIDRELNANDTLLSDVELKRTVLSNAKETFLLADSSKLNRDGVIDIADISAFTRIITNEQADPLFVEQLLEKSCKVDLVPASPEFC